MSEFEFAELSPKFEFQQSKGVSGGLYPLEGGITVLFKKTGSFGGHKESRIRLSNRIDRLTWASP